MAGRPRVYPRTKTIACLDCGAVLEVDRYSTRKYCDACIRVRRLKPLDAQRNNNFASRALCWTCANTHDRKCVWIKSGAKIKPVGATLLVREVTNAQGGTLRVMVGCPNYQKEGKA